MAARRKSDLLRDDLCADALRKRASLIASALGIQSQSADHGVLAVASLASFALIRLSREMTK